MHHFANKGPYSQSYGFPNQYGYESWTIKKAHCWRTDGFKLFWRILLRVPWTARRSNQSILKEINPEYSLAGLMLKLKLQYFGHPMRRTDSLEKTLILRKTEGKRRRGQQRMRWLDSITDSMDMSPWANSGRQGKTEKPGVLQCMGLQRVGYDLVTEQQQSFRMLYYIHTANNLLRDSAFFHRTPLFKILWWLFNSPKV